MLNISLTQKVHYSVLHFEILYCMQVRVSNVSFCNWFTFALTCNYPKSYNK